LSVGQLKAAGAEGRLTSEVVFRALLTQTDALRTKFESLPPSLQRAGQALENSLGVAIGAY
jgi:hypothetical protein